jgi:hypothetical protein
MRPVECKLQHLTMEFFTEKRVLQVLHHAPDLQTLVLGIRVQCASSELKSKEKSLFTPHQRLTSLRISKCSLPMYEIQPLLSLTPSLTHLRIIGTNISMINGSRWEDFIKTKLPALNKFEFCIRLSLDCDGDAVQSRLDDLIAPFCTLFWTKEKRWPVICNWFPIHQFGEIYTLPICKPNCVHFADPYTRTASNFVSDVQLTTTIPEAVLQLHVKPYIASRCEDRVSPSCSIMTEL